MPNDKTGIDKKRDRWRSQEFTKNDRHFKRIKKWRKDRNIAEGRDPITGRLLSNSPLPYKGEKVLTTPS